MQLIVYGGKRILERLPVFLAQTVSDRWQEFTRASVAPEELPQIVPGAENLFAGDQYLRAFRYQIKLFFRGDLWVDPAVPLLRVCGQAYPEAVLRQEKGVWLVPARDAFAALNARVSWDAKRREVVVTAGGLLSRAPRDPVVNRIWKAIGATFESWAERYGGEPVSHMRVEAPLVIRFPVDPQSILLYDPVAKKTRTRPCYFAYVNGHRYVLYDPAVPAGRVAPRLVNSRFYLPVRIFPDIFGALVAWDEETRELRIDGLRFWQTQ